ncbi:MAG TPA: c-type cytochrome [Anaerolineales bacterium]|nr:c-type cytochrome [Anaerolineales bacterium]
MKKVLKWIGIVLGSLAGLILIAAVGLYAKGMFEFNKPYEAQIRLVEIPADAESIEHGRHLADFLCAECHGDDLGGKPVFVDLPGMVTISTPNITSGQGGVVAGFTDEDWIRSLRHGIKQDGTSSFLMRSMDYQYFSDKDLRDVIAYLKTAPPVDREIPPYQMTFLGRVAYGAGAFGNLLGASVIDHENLPTSTVEAGVTVEYGEYLIDINGCRGCHGAELAGADPPDPASMLAPNLTPGGSLASWSEADFIQTFRTGIVPEGRRLVLQFMPWEYKGRMTDDELTAIFLYLQSLPALETSTAPVE